MSGIVAHLEKLAFKIFRVASVEALIKRLLVLVFWIALLLPLVLIPLYYFFYTLI